MTEEVQHMVRLLYDYALTRGPRMRPRVVGRMLLFIRRRTKSGPLNQVARKWLKDGARISPGNLALLLSVMECNQLQQVVAEMVWRDQMIWI